MKTENTYSYPVEEKYIQKIVTKESPAHVICKGEDNISEYDLTNAVDFICSERTPIKAALSGEVVAVLDNMNKNWDKWEAPLHSVMNEIEQDGNYVVIEHKEKNSHNTVICHTRKCWSRKDKILKQEKQ